MGPSGDERGHGEPLFRRPCPCVRVPLDAATALLTADLPRDHGLAACDALIYAAATQHRVRLVTTDAALDGLANVDFHPKPGRDPPGSKGLRAAARKGGTR